jgi:hypothetical protein
VPVSIEPFLNVIQFDNSVTVTRKISSGYVFANCPVKKKKRLDSLLAVRAVVIPPVIPVMDARQSIFIYLRAMKDEGYEQFHP